MDQDEPLSSAQTPSPPFGQALGPPGPLSGAAQKDADAPLAGRSAIVVDDYAPLTRQWASWLALAGANPVVKATTAAEARQAMATQRFDLALLDHLLPDGTGVELARELKTAHPSARVILITGVTPRDIAEDGVFEDLVQYCDAFISKPCNIEELLGHLQRLFSGPGARSPSHDPSERSSAPEPRSPPGHIVSPGQPRAATASPLGLSPGQISNLALQQQWMDASGAWVRAGHFFVHHELERVLLNLEPLSLTPALRLLLTYLILSSHEPITLLQMQWILRSTDGALASESVAYRRVYELRNQLDQRTRGFRRSGSWPSVGQPSVSQQSADQPSADQPSIGPIYLANTPSSYVFQPDGRSGIDSTEPPCPVDHGESIYRQLKQLPTHRKLQNLSGPRPCVK